MFNRPKLVGYAKLLKYIFPSVALVSTPSFAANQISGKSELYRGGGLMCFSIFSPAARATLPPERQARARHGWPAQSSCDAMCMAQGAACVATDGFGASMNAPPCRLMWLS
jgi:hypothetical protein